MYSDLGLADVKSAALSSLQIRGCGITRSKGQRLNLLDENIPAFDIQ